MKGSVWRSVSSSTNRATADRPSLDTSTPTIAGTRAPAPEREDDRPQQWRSAPHICGKAGHNDMPLVAVTSGQWAPSEKTLVVSQSHGGSEQHGVILDGPQDRTMDDQPTDDEGPAIGSPKAHPQSSNEDVPI